MLGFKNVTLNFNMIPSYVNDHFRTFQIRSRIGYTTYTYYQSYALSVKVLALLLYKLYIHICFTSLIVSWNDSPHSFSWQNWPWPKLSTFVIFPFQNNATCAASVIRSILRLLKLHGDISSPFVLVDALQLWVFEYFATGHGFWVGLKQQSLPFTILMHIWKRHVAVAEEHYGPWSIHQGR